MVALAGCLPMPLLRHHLARFSAKLLAVNPSRVPPQHKPPSGAKSGLGGEASELVDISASCGQERSSNSAAL
jgi:hypothetical protein